MFQKIIDFFGALGTFILSLIIVAVLLCVVPALTLWSINTISEQSGIKFYIPHNLWTYLSVIILWMFMSPQLIAKKEK